MLRCWFTSGWALFRGLLLRLLAESLLEDPGFVCTDGVTKIDFSEETEFSLTASALLSRLLLLHLGLEPNREIAIGKLAL